MLGALSRALEGETLINEEKQGQSVADDDVSSETADESSSAYTGIGSVAMIRFSTAVTARRSSSASLDWRPSERR